MPLKTSSKALFYFSAVKSAFLLVRPLTPSALTKGEKTSQKQKRLAPIQQARRKKLRSQKRKRANTQKAEVETAKVSK